MSTTRPRVLRRTAPAGLLAAAALALAGCGGSASGGDAASADTASGDGAPTTVSVTDSQDRTVEVATEPEVVVATDWSVIRTLADLGIEADAVPTPNSTLPEDLAVYEGEEVPKVGDVFEPDYEAIAAMEPDLVIVGSRSGTPEVVAEFERFAPAVLDMSVRATDPAEILAETRERVEALGAVFGIDTEASALMDDVEAEVAAVREEVQATGRTAMVVQVSDGTVSAYGPGSRFGTVFADFGYDPTDAPLDGDGGHGEEISQEFFVEYDPDVLFVLDRAKAIGQDATPALDVLEGGLADSTTAAQEDRVVEIDGFAWYLATSAPGSWLQMAADVRGSL